MTTMFLKKELEPKRNSLIDDIKIGMLLFAIIGLYTFHKTSDILISSSVVLTLYIFLVLRYSRYNNVLHISICESQLKLCFSYMTFWKKEMNLDSSTLTLKKKKETRVYNLPEDVIEFYNSGIKIKPKVIISRDKWSECNVDFLLKYINNRN